MNAILLSIGDELTLGQIIDTNSAWLSSQLAAIGVSISMHITVPDDLGAIIDAIVMASKQSDVLICTGGLGPTADDLTRDAIARTTGQPLEMNEDWLKELEKFFAARHRPMTENNKVQALIPRGARMIWNTCGTAPGIAVQIGKSLVYSTPGVPREMHEMFNRDILPEIEPLSSGAVILSRTLHTFGLGESAIGDRLGALMDRTRNPSVGTTASNGFVSLRINSRFPNKIQAYKELEETDRQCRKALGELIFGADDQTLPQAVMELLKREKKSVTTAESCTAGLMAKLITDVPGSSSHYKRGWIVYSNEAKTDLLGVSKALLDSFGAVSENVATAMAMGALARSDADYAIGISGIAGPDGGSEEKPVGMVCVALANRTANAADAYTFHFPGGREMIRDRAAKMGLALLRWNLLGVRPPI